MAMLVLNYWLREFLLSEIANRFELGCESKQLMLLYYKICLCSMIISKFLIRILLKRFNVDLNGGDNIFMKNNRIKMGESSLLHSRWKFF